MNELKFAKVFQHMFCVLMLCVTLGFVCACGGDDDDSGVDNTVSSIAVTGDVEVCGCTYASIGGYANLTLLPAGNGNYEIGVEVYPADSEYGDYPCDKETSIELTGNRFSVYFDDLSPKTTYKYRSYVEYSGLVHYGDYRTFTTKDFTNIASTGEVSEITYRSAVVTLSVKTEAIDPKEESLRFGVAYSTSKSALHSDSLFSRKSVSVYDIEEGGIYVLTLSKLSKETTYYYAAYTELDGVYRFSEIKKFTTEEFQSALNGHEAVDLGLPSGLLWATCNVGASSPEEYGGYFAWGETTTKSSYYSDNSTTYGLSVSELESRGIIGSDGNLTADYDAATANWGGSWRMPTLGEMTELLDNCTWTWTTQNGVKGRKVTGPNGNSIFLPAAGDRGGTDLYNAGSYGGYWSATPSSGSSYACGLDFYSGDYGWGSSLRIYGRAVRPVSE